MHIDDLQDLTMVLSGLHGLLHIVCDAECSVDGKTVQSVTAPAYLLLAELAGAAVEFVDAHECCLTVALSSENKERGTINK